MKSTLVSRIRLEPLAQQGFQRIKSAVEVVVEVIAKTRDGAGQALQILLILMYLVLDLCYGCLKGLLLLADLVEVLRKGLILCTNLCHARLKGMKALLDLWIRSGVAGACLARVECFDLLLQRGLNLSAKLFCNLIVALGAKGGSQRSGGARWLRFLRCAPGILVRVKPRIICRHCFVSLNSADV